MSIVGFSKFSNEVHPNQFKWLRDLKKKIIVKLIILKLHRMLVYCYNFFKYIISRFLSNENIVWLNVIICYGRWLTFIGMYSAGFLIVAALAWQSAHCET